MEREFAHEITIPAAPADVLPLFTPKGEERWVPGWSPTYYSPVHGATEREMVFRTGEGDATTWWTCLEWNPDELHARYFRLTPATRAAFVDVRCRPAAENRTTVRVAYRHVALNDAGRAEIAAITAESFAAAIDAWAGLISASGAIEARD